MTTDIFLLFGIGFLIGLITGIIVRVWQKYTNEYQKFKDKYNL